MYPSLGDKYPASYSAKVTSSSSSANLWGASKISLESNNQLEQIFAERSAYLLDSLRFLLCSLPGLFTKMAANPLPLPEVLTESRLDGLLPGI